jgi:hypothetical protein
MAVGIALRMVTNWSLDKKVTINNNRLKGVKKIVRHLGGSAL